MSRNSLLIQIFVLVVVVAVLVIILSLARTRARDYSIKYRCACNLKTIATAMNMYMTGSGDGKWYPQPAEVFYGDTWLLSLYWENIFKEPKLVFCPGTTDDPSKLTALTPRKYDVCLDGDAISYAGRCSGLLSREWRNSVDFSEKGMSANSMCACDDNQGTDNHADGFNAVFFDSHVDFIPNERGHSAYSQIGAKGATWCNGELEKMDSGGG